ncbi:MAG: sigma-70 family RNA polymerase sigma factor [Opitutus sp.]|nr:sigma-70 family RNA polymerase sigma factor [Opitutus sp.]
MNLQCKHPPRDYPPADFTTFMRNYQDMVFSVAVRLTANEAQAEDISQEVFLKAFENFDHLSTSPTAGGWLKTVATNLSLNHLSRYRKRWRSSRTPPDLCRPDSTPRRWPHSRPSLRPSRMRR